jgi:hypothetical protein
MPESLRSMGPNYVKSVHSASSRPLGVERMTSVQVFLSSMHYDRIITIPTDELPQYYYSHNNITTLQLVHISGLIAS